MMRSFAVLRCTLICLLGGLAMLSSHAAEPVAATALIDRIVAAYGGAATIERIVSIEAQGGIMAALRGGQGSYTRWIKRPRQLRVETAFPGTRETRILDGATVWRGNDGALRPAAGQARLAVIYQYKQLELPYGLLKGKYRLRHAGSMALDGREVEVLELEDDEGPPLRVHVDTESGLIVRVAGRFSHGTLSTELAIAFADFRNVEGMPMPFRIRNFAGGQQVSETLIHHYRVNPALTPELFRPVAPPPGGDGTL